MFYENTIVAFVEALQATVDADNPYENLRNLSVHTEYPMDEASYPGMWVNFIPQGDVSNVGIGHVEYYDRGQGIKEFYRWEFRGALEIVVAALSSLERARMVDALAKTIAFGHADGDTPLSDFRKSIESNDLIGFRVIWEAFTLTGSAETPGTPWDTDDVIYEVTLTLTVEGEVLYDPNDRVLVPLAAVVVDAEPSDEPVSPPPAEQGWV